MNVLVTGGAGFIGSHLVDLLVKDQTEHIVVYDNFYRGREANIAQHLGNPAVQLEKGDLRDYDRLLGVMRHSDVVYHLGAQSNVIGAVRDTDYSFQTNVFGTYNVLKGARETGVKKVVFTSSREVYGEARYLPVDEAHPIGSKNTYGASKVAGEMYCQVFQNLFDVQTVILRLSNVYGPRDFGRVIPIWLERAHRHQNLEIYGGEQVIDFVWIEQVVEALIRATTLGRVEQAINVGSGQGTQILDLARRILALIDTPSQIDLKPVRSAEVVRFTADVTRMKDILGLTPSADPLDGLSRMIDLPAS
ncbi:MAG: NAD-dependent epimerase/dehydratase family protein [Anaerolineae bacterium]|nr:NAD-dependent epimerase/dehydratase family protein [Anaerolineae bacterium]